MGNIISGAATGMFIYVTDMVLRQFVPGGGFMEMFKFILQGILTYWFVMAVDNFAEQRT